jgi:hypothetical protein
VGAASWSLNRDSLIDVVLSRRAARNETLAIYGAADGTFLPAERLDEQIDDLVDADDDGELDIVTIEESALVLRYARGGDLFDERHYALSLTSEMTRNVALEPARGGDAPKVHALVQPNECAFACSAQCGACIFGACAECLNHDDCASGECRYGRCTAPPDEDAGVN